MVTMNLSPVHVMLDSIERHTDAEFANRVANDPTVYRWVHGGIEGPMDLSAIAANPLNILLVGEHGFEMFAYVQPGLYEAHTSILPSGRGEWAVLFVRACLHWLFTRTLALEVMTRCPTHQAKALAKAIDGTYQFTNPRGWVLDGKVVPADIYGLTIMDWLRIAPGLPERGHWFHERLESEYVRLGAADPSPHPDDAMHDRYVGAAAEMFIGHQPDKAVTFYNRWAAFSGYAPVSIVSKQPLTINIRDALLIVRDNGDFFAATLLDKAA